MKPTRLRDLWLAGLVAALLAHVLGQLSYASLPSLPLFAGVTLGVLGIAEAVAGTILKARIDRKPGTKPLDPLVAARALLVAQASALGGAIVAGLWAGLLAYVGPRVGSAAVLASDAASATIGLVCALGLVAGALWLERCCRAPDGRARGEGRATGRETGQEGDGRPGEPGATGEPAD